MKRRIAAMALAAGLYTLCICAAVDAAGWTRTWWLSGAAGLFGCIAGHLGWRQQARIRRAERDARAWKDHAMTAWSRYHDLHEDSMRLLTAARREEER